MGIIITIIVGGSTILAFLSLFFAVVKLSWEAMFISLIASLPISIYLIGVNPPLRFLGLIPILFLILTIILRRHSQKAITQ